jgi:hypothetical protein
LVSCGDGSHPVRLAYEPPALARDELTRRGRAATVVIEYSSGSTHVMGICIDPGGLFVTSSSAVVDPDKRTLVETPNIIVRPGQGAREVLAGKLVCRLTEPNLAFVRVNATGSKREFDALPLGLDSGLDELMDVLAFGVPFPRAADYPSIHVATGSISALPMKDGRLERIQFEPIGRGFAGGPLLDTQGRLVGVILGQARADFGSGVGLAVPAGALRRSLDTPLIEFAPPVVQEEDASQPVRFEARAFSLIPAQGPLDLELVLGGAPGSSRRFPMTRSGETYSVSAALLPGKGTPSVGMKARFEDGRIQGQVSDLTFRIGSRDLRLSQVRSLKLAPGPTAVLGNGDTLDGPVSGLGKIPVTVGGQSLDVDLAQASEIHVAAPESFDPIPCTVIARRAGAEKARLATPIDLGGRSCFEALRADRFSPPRRASAPVTYISIVSSPGEYVGEGRTFHFREGIVVRSVGYSRYLENGVLVSRANSLRGVDVEVGAITSRDHWSFRFEASLNQNLRAGDYLDARRIDVTGEHPEIHYGGRGRGHGMLSGRFVVWEVELSGNEIKRLAVDFVAHGRENGRDSPPLFGMIRYQSSFE